MVLHPILDSEPWYQVPLYLLSSGLIIVCPAQGMTSSVWFREQYQLGSVPCSLPLSGPSISSLALAPVHPSVLVG